MRIPLVQRWWMLFAAAAAVAASISLTSDHTNFLQVPELNALGLGFKVLPPMSKITRRNDNTTIPCQPIETERGTANVTWMNRIEVINDARRPILPNGTLLITNVQDRDIELYQCILTSGIYSVTSAFTYLRFAVTRVWQIKPQNNTVEVGRAVRLTCYMASLPIASYIWLKDNQTLPENETRYYEPTSGVLQITKIDYQDEGMYRCKAVNQVLKQEFLSSGGYLSVIPRKSDDRSFQHSILGVPSKVEVIEGEQAVLECITDGEKPKIEWSRPDEVPIGNKTIRIGQGSLVFPSVSEQDTGRYNCTAINRNSRIPVITQMIELSMTTKPKIQISVTADKRSIPKNNVINNGQSVRITCSTWGTPVPTISWYKNGRLHVETGRHKHINQNSSISFASEDLYIGFTMLKDRGVYQCVTRNRAGVASDAFILDIYIPKNSPEPPVNIRVVEITPYSISLRWDPPPDTNVSGYVITYVVDKSKELQRIANKTSCVMKELKPRCIYDIYIRSFFITTENFFISEPSLTITIKTKDDCPNRMPEVTLYATSHTELYANWTHVQCKNKNPIVQQKIQWKKKAHYFLEKKLAPNVTELHLSNLQPNKAYKVRVLVATNKGYPEHMIQLRWYSIKMPRNSSDVARDNSLLNIRLFTCSQRPTEILANWTLAGSLQDEVSSYFIMCNASISNWHREQQVTGTSFVFNDLEPNTCYGVRVRATYKSNRNHTNSHVKTICTLPQLPFILLPRPNTNKIRVKRLRTKVLNTTSVLVTWRHTSRKIPVNFYTIKVESVNSGMDSQIEATAEELTEENEMNLKDSQIVNHTPSSTLPTHYEDEPYVVDSCSSETEGQLGNDIRLYRVTSRRLIVTNLKTLHNYSIIVSASTGYLTGRPTKAFVTPDEGVPTPPLNVTWVPASPKDAILSWNPPRLINGRLCFYLVAFSHDQQEWRNETIPHNRTTAQIEDLVSNTNYTLHIAGVTNKGVGASTTVFIYIRATLEGEPHIPTQLAVISVVSFLVVVTCVVAVFLCLRNIRLRNNSPSVFQGNGTCRMAYANGVKTPGRDHGTEPDDYKPMLASLPPATQNHHLDTKGGPGSHDDGIVANSLFDPSAIQMNQDDGTNEGMEPLRDGLNHHRMMDTLDDIDDADDGSRRLLQSVSTAQPVFSKNMKEFNSRAMYNSTQADHHSSSDGARIEPEVSS